MLRANKNHGVMVVNGMVSELKFPTSNSDHQHHRKSSAELVGSARSSSGAA